MTYKWAISEGTIIKGQGTRSIKARMKSPVQDSYTVSLEIGGLDPMCDTRISASCSLIIEPPIPNEKFGTYGVLPRRKEKIKLADFATALKYRPGAMGYVLFYEARRGFAGYAKTMSERAGAYLVNELAIQNGRIVTVQGGFREKATVDLWIAPAGAVPPKPESNLDASELKSVRTPKKTTKQHRAH
jgi:hypothetical protein